MLKLKDAKFDTYFDWYRRIYQIYYANYTKYIK